MDSKEAAKAISLFSTKFCNELDKSKSVVSSPLSAEILLALLTLGTTDPAHAQLLQSLGLKDDDSIRSSFKAVSSKLRDVKGVTLNIANKVYYYKDGETNVLEVIYPELRKDAVEVFDADFEQVDFTQSAQAATHINQWVEKKTNDRIKDLLSPDDFDKDTRLVLVNAIYFKGSWKKKFNAEMTSDQPFHVNAITEVNVPMMYQESKFRYGESAELNAQLLEMPYEGDQTSMVVVLPREVEGLEAVMTKLAAGYDLVEELDKMFETKVQVTLPKFKIETEIDLKALLPKLGIKAIFDEKNSGLTRILQNDERLVVSKAIQKAFIEVNEEGAEAAAATGLVVSTFSMSLSPSVRADRPFLYVLRDAERSTLFLGIYNGRDL
nr:antichymotrypsin-2-like protein [Yponomeuta cagnagella]